MPCKAKADRTVARRNSGRGRGPEYADLVPGGIEPPEGVDDMAVEELPVVLVPGEVCSGLCLDEGSVLGEEARAAGEGFLECSVAASS